MIAFRKKWDSRQLEDAGAYMSKEADGFCNTFRNMLKRIGKTKGFEVVSFTKGHYYLSAFCKNGDTFVYLNFDIPRHKPLCFYKDKCLVRYAKDARDYRGEHNQYCSLYDLPEKLDAMFERRTVLPY